MSYVSLRLWGGSVSNHPVKKGWSAKEKPSRAWGVGEGEVGEVRYVAFYEGLRLWEARLVVFYESLRFWGSSGSNEAVTRGGSAKERPSRAWGDWGRGMGGEARFVVFYEGLKLWEVRFVMFYEGG